MHISTLTSNTHIATNQCTHTYVVVYEVWVVPLDAVVQDGDHHILPCVASLPGTHDVHARLAVMDVIVTVLEWRSVVQLLTVMVLFCSY